MDNAYKVIILAAGFGIRLGVYGEQLPKGLIPAGKTTIIGKTIDALRQAEINNIILVTNNKFFNDYQNYFNNHHGLRIRILNNLVDRNKERKGALGDLISIISKFNFWNDNLLVLPSDTYYDLSLKKLLEFSNDKNGFVTVFRRFENRLSIKNRLGCGVFGDNNKLIYFIEKPDVPATNFGAVPIYIYPAKVVKFLKNYQKSGRSLDAPGSIIPWLIRQKIPVYGYIMNKFSLDVGTKDDINYLNNYLKE